MIGLGEEIDSPYVVPQNSVVNFGHKVGLYEKQPIQNSSRNLKAAHSKCPHCENMAKNFLYLESLIRSNYNANNHCNVCHSSLQYLQYVNKSIIEVFGNFDSIVEAAKAFGNPEKRYNKLVKQRSRQSKLNSSFTSAILQKSASFKKPAAEIINTFVNDAYQERLIFTLNAAAVLVPSFNFPEKPTSKVVYFIRNDVPSNLTLQNMSSALMIGDILPNVLENLSVICDDVIFPLLNNPVNQNGWTSVIVNDMKTESQDLRNGIAQMKGLVINRTILPLPICIDEVMESAPAIAKGDLGKVNHLMKHALEFMVVKWLDSVEDLVHVKAKDKIFSKDEFPRPEHLVGFWETRLENLENLADQLGDKRIKTIGFVLERIRSVFESSYRRIVELVLEALAEARDITKYLTPLRKVIDKFETADMDENRANIRPLLLTVGLVWGHSKYFHTLDNMVLLFQLLHNTLIECAMRTIEPDAIFQGDVDEAYKKITTNINHLEYYRSTYKDTRGSLKKFKVGTEFNSQDWTWHPSEIFDRFDKFITRLETLGELFETGRDFLKLEKVTVGGLKGRQITMAIEKILEEYNGYYREWSNIQYNPLDPDYQGSTFESDRVAFKEKTDILERKIAYQFEKALEDSHDLLLCGTLLLRPIIKAHIDPFMHILIDDFADEIASVKVDFNEFQKTCETEGISALNTDMCFPPVTGALSWLNKLQYRISWIRTDYELYDYP
ncbi:dynein beta chain, ciliary [Glossina fuscipes fuscipes]